MKNHDYSWHERSYGLSGLRTGMRVRLEGKEGILAGTHDCYVLIKFPDRKTAVPAHPTWMMEYSKELFDNER